MKTIFFSSIIFLCIFCYTQIFASTGEIMDSEQIETISVEINGEEEEKAESESESESEIAEQPENILNEENIELEDDNESGSGIISNDIIGETEKEKEFIFNIGFQNPTYLLEKDIEKDSYICDPEREECKMNIIFQDELGESLSSKYICSYKIESEEFISCNPTTIIIEKYSEILYSVYHKDEPNTLYEKTISYIVNQNIEDTDGSTEETRESEDSEQEIISGTGGNQGEGETSTGVLAPEIVLEVQSGLEETGTGNIYICKSEECRVNLDISESFTGSFSSGDYDCEWNFGSGSFSTSDTDKKCNPGYVTFSGGIHSLQSHIYYKHDRSIFSEYNFIIQNNFSFVDETIGEENNEEREEKAEDWDDNNSESGTGVTNTGSIDSGDDTIAGSGGLNQDPGTGSGELSGTGIINIGIGNTHTGVIQDIFLFPEIIIEIQSGAQKISEEVFVCNKNDCKLNLDTSDIFVGDFEEKNYECLWDFGRGAFSSTGTLSKCNPGYIDYAIGEYNITYLLYEKENRLNFIQKSIIIKNQEIVSVPQSRGASSSASSYQPKTDYNAVTSDKQIILQSGLEGNICNSELCKINLNYKNSSYETCSWNFGISDVVEKYITTCNPGFLYYSNGAHKVELTVFNEKTGKNYYKYISFENIYIQAENIAILEEDVDKEEGENIEQVIPESFTIELQGKKTDFKKYIGENILCFGVDKCSINLNLIQESKNKYKYSWDLGNGSISEKKNPKSQWYEKGKYDITLEIIGENKTYTKILFIEVLGKELEQEDEEKLLEIEKFEKQQDSFLVNLFSQDKTDVSYINNIQEKLGRENINNILQGQFINTEKYIEKIGWFEQKTQKNTKLKLTRSIDKQKKSLKISGVTLPNSTVFVNFGYKILEITSDNEGKYSLHTADVLEGVYDLEYMVLDENGDLFESKTTKNLILEREYIETMKSYEIKKATQKKKTVKKVTEKPSNDLGGEENQEDFYQEEIIQRELTLQEKIFQVFLIIISLAGGIVILRRYKII